MILLLFLAGPGGKANGEARALAELGGDDELGTVPVENVLDDGESKAGAAARTALLNADPIEPFRQPGKVLRRNARPKIQDAEFDVTILIARRRNLDAFPAACILNGIFDEIAGDLEQLVMVTSHHQSAGQVERNLDACLLSGGKQRIGGLANDGGNIDECG